MNQLLEAFISGLIIGITLCCFIAYKILTYKKTEWTQTTIDLTPDEPKIVTKYISKACHFCEVNNVYLLNHNGDLYCMNCGTTKTK